MALKVTPRGVPLPLNRAEAGSAALARAAEQEAATKPAGWKAPAPELGRMRVRAAEVKPPVAPPVKGFDDPAFESTLDMSTHSRTRMGNQVTPLFDGVESFKARSELINGAKESINFQTFIFNSDDTGWETAKALAAKAKEGVKVRVIYDAVGSMRADPKMFEMMKNAGVELREFGKFTDRPFDLNDRWHEKHLIVDGRTSIEGGMNVANEYALGGSGKMVFSRKNKEGEHAWRDVDVKLEGPAVRDAQTAFIKNWELVDKKELPEAEKMRLLPPLMDLPANVPVRVVQHRPDQENDQNVMNLYLKAIDTSKKSITIENAYFVPPQELRRSLINAAKRGVDVRVMTNSRASNDTTAVADASRYFYDDLMKAGVKIYEKQGGTLHSKTATFDGQYSVIGSANLNGRSKGRDSEVIIAVRDGATAKKLEERFANGLEQTHPVTLEELKKEGVFTNLKQWAASTLAWTF